jgi:cyclic pyranopterin phosphate synthase
MPDEDISCATREQLMSPSEIQTLATTFVGLGVRKIRLTGGEPLVRKEAAEIIERLSQLPVELTMTTNALRLHEFMPQIQAAKMHSLNVSLDTLNPETFRFITRREGFEKVLQNIEVLISAGIHAKVNMVVMRGINEKEVNDFVRWTVDTPVHVRFIEFMPFSGNQWHGDKVFSLDEMLEQIGAEFEFISLGKEPHATARKYFVPGARGTFAIISTMSHPFCGDCNRMRLTADGKLKNCLFSEKETDLLSALRKGEDVEPLIRKSILEKKEMLGGQFDAEYKKLDADEIHNRSMIRIGG